ncbi:MAG: Lrp/AsnC family transcriptional regulator [Pseudomonadota bacterium]
MTDSFTLDRYDLSILRALQDDARMSWVELAERVSLSPSACQRRARQLHDRGVISRFTLDVDLQAMGYDVEAFVAVSIERQNMKYAAEFRRAIAGLPEVRDCYMLSGSVDFMLRVVAPNLRAFGSFIQREILNLPGVKDATSSIVLERIDTDLSIVPTG